MTHARAWTEVDLSSLRHNVCTIQAAVGPSVGILAVVKANAYGHGAIPVAKAAIEAGATRLGVADLREARELREAGIFAPIQVLGALFLEEIDTAVEYGVVIPAQTPEEIAEISRCAKRRGRRVPVHLFCDTGMGRLGAMPHEICDLAKMVRAEPLLRLEGVATHFASADAADPAQSRSQIDRFNGVLEELKTAGLRPPIVHASASAAAFRFPEARYSMIRPGLALLGLDPFGDGRELGLKPVLSLHSRLIHLKNVATGSPLGYGATFVTKRPTRVASVPIGYDDGVPFHAAKGGSVLVRGRRCAIVGRVMMDYILIDVTDVPDVTAADTVTLIGTSGTERIMAAEVAKTAGLIPYAVLCGLGRRVRRCVLGATEIKSEPKAGAETIHDKKTELDRSAENVVPTMVRRIPVDARTLPLRAAMRDPQRR